jgi:hypothetical protein
MQKKGLIDAIIASPFRAPELLAYAEVTLFSRKTSGEARTSHLRTSAAAPEQSQIRGLAKS